MTSKSGQKKSAPKKIGTECPICLETLVYPCELTCGHVFCFLCIKGFVNTQNSRCALCRTEIPADYLNKPDLVLDASGFENSSATATASAPLQPNSRHTTHVWYYQGRNGWWQYDERTNDEIEKEFRQNPKSKFELLIAGLLYSIDLENGVQARADDPVKKRRIKRDLRNMSHTKGVAGIHGFVQSKNASK